MYDLRSSSFESTNVLYIIPTDDASMQELCMNINKNVQDVFPLQNGHFVFRISIYFSTP